ncbi:hypothetical protein IV203_015077 [Nitzschia inconspicua]|uniref:Uncharacterized protein n=1 Tax=Nitzschia inconspicua TaxID=303405 RepID=A0A9K3LBJ0_9STRA|nr:hypothetical protein IV203_015077 [Nitzschia inconspicua]
MRQSSSFGPISWNNALAPTLRVNSEALWKVTLGFLPAFVNLHKRLYGPETDEDDDSSVLPRKRVVNSIEFDEFAPEVESLSDISDSSYSSGSSSCCSSNSSEYTSASGEWSDVDPSLQDYSSCYNSSVSSSYDSKSKAATQPSFSGSIYDFGRKPREQASSNRESKKTVPTRWVKKFSRIFHGGGDDCNHTV